eukprot:TRINITY_DN3536_c0_g1_i5.p1 TRINITY_DN3536_c0_g1~~TRINITY_DN3536_c0_g1_i5.p1  ORF type:complete len:395 (+),score=89.67 TRINITY_DN3536_c0_g1_i5:29-1186(+)
MKGSDENEVFVIRTGPTTVSRNKTNSQVTLHSVLDKFCSNRSMVLSDFSVRKSTNFEFIEDLDTPLNKLGTSEVLLDKNSVIEEMEKFHQLVEEGNLVLVTDFHLNRSPQFDINFHGIDKGRTALHKSCQFGHKNVSLFLLKNGAKVDERDGMGWYPIHCAALGTHCEVVDLLVDKGHDVNALNSDMNSAIHYLVRTEYSSKLTKTLDNLLQRGANINITNTNGDTPLHHVVEKNRYEIVKYLLKNGSSLTITNKRNFTPLELAQELNRKEIISIIENFTKAPLIPSIAYDIPDMVSSHYAWQAFLRQNIYDDLEGPAPPLPLAGGPEDAPVVPDAFVVREMNALLLRTYSELFASTKALRDDIAEVVNLTQDSEIEIMKLQKKL